jgi:hypothetical protein
MAGNPQATPGEAPAVADRGRDQGARREKFFLAARPV